MNVRDERHGGEGQSGKPLHTGGVYVSSSYCHTPEWTFHPCTYWQKGSQASCVKAAEM